MKPRSPVDINTSLDRLRPPVVAVALISAAALAYEILLMRLFSIVLWHHFAYMIISLALLGYGASGALLSLFQDKVQEHFARAFSGFAAVFGISAIGCFFLAQQVAFNPLEILWDPRQPIKLLAVYLALLPPFFCAGACVCMALSRFQAEVPRIYSFDILGAGAGSLGIVLLLFAVSPADALKGIASLGLLAAAAAWLECRGAYRARPSWPAALLAASAAFPLFVPESWIPIAISPYKELAHTLRIPGARVVEQRSSPLGLVTVVESPRIPLRHAPGLSLNATVEPPPQLGVFTDGEGMNALTRFDGRIEPLAYLDYLSSALPYHLLKEPRVLVLGAGAGSDVLQAITHRAKTIDAVELNPQVVDLVERGYAEYSGGIYSIARMHVAEARGYVAGNKERYDLIQVALLDSFAASSAGLYALSESYLYTVEALQEYLQHLQPGGMLAITRWVTLPPRDTLKLFAAAVAALERSGIADPGSRLAMIRSWKTSTLLLKNGELGADDIAAIRKFCEARSFDVDFYPGMRPEEANRYNVLDRPYLFEGAAALLGPDRKEFVRNYKFNIAPATDDKPYFFHFFKWKTLPELVSLRGQGGLPLLEWGYPVLAATLVQATVVSLLLIAAPVAFWGRRRKKTARPSHETTTLGPVRAAEPIERPHQDGSNDGTKSAKPFSRTRVLVYFLAIGFGFMFIEIAFIQKFVLFLSHPLYAVAVVLFAFLLFAGVGSRFSARLQGGFGVQRRPMPWVVSAIAIAAVLCLTLLPWLFHHSMGLPDPVKIAISAFLIAPLAFFMGMPFPLALSKLPDPRVVSWAWAVNGCASVTGAVLATLLAIHFGFTLVIAGALLLYALAAAAYP